MSNPRHLLLAGLLAVASTWGLAQTAPAPDAGAAPAAAQSSPSDAAPRAQRWAERRARRLDQLKAALQLSAAQQDAWSQFSAAMQPPRPAGARMSRADWAQLNTPQRIERIRARQAERQQRMSQRLDAVQAFYAQLTPEQQKVFDQQTLRHGRGQRRGHGHGMYPG